jgi:hypothetical protein
MFAIRPAAIIACAIGALISTAALPFDNGQWNDVPDQVRSCRHFSCRLADIF